WIPATFCTAISSVFLIDRPTTQSYTLSLHDALPILKEEIEAFAKRFRQQTDLTLEFDDEACDALIDESVSQDKTIRSVAEEKFRSEEHTSELQSRENLVCRLLLEKKKTYSTWNQYHS